MLKILTLFCFLLITLTSFSQKTKTPITGVDAIELGDSINHIDTYGFPFVAVTKYHVSDSSSKLNIPKKILTKDELKDIEYDVEFKTSDSGRTFCPDVSVFISDSFNFNQIQHSKTATLALTYFKKNKLIDIRIIDRIKHISANFMYCLKKYGKGFAEQLDGYTLLEGRYPNNKMPSEDFTKTPIATIANQLSDNAHIETVYWKNGNHSFSFNQCSYPYTFWAEKLFLNDECSWCGCAEAAIIIKNDKAYKAMTECSNETLKQQMINNKQLPN